MDNLKDFIDNELETVIPVDFSSNIHRNVMGALAHGNYLGLNYKHSESKDNIVLALGLIALTVLIYLFGFNKSFMLTIQLPTELIFKSLVKFLSCGLILLLLINELFDRKKKVLI